MQAVINIASFFFFFYYYYYYYYSVSVYATASLDWSKAYR